MFAVVVMFGCQCQDSIADLWFLSVLTLYVLSSAIVQQRRSFLSRALQTAATGPLRQTLLKFFAASGEHSKRLTSPECNAKFQSIESGPDADFNPEGGNLGQVVSALKKRYGLRYVYCWHAILGYWSGISSQDPGFAELQPAVVMPRLTDDQYQLEPPIAWNQQVGVCACPHSRDMHC